METYSIEELSKISWIANSKLIQTLDQDDDEVTLPKFKLIPDILTNEKLKDVYNAIRILDGQPENFLDYIRGLKQEEFDELLDELGRKSGEYQFILKLRFFNSTKRDELCYLSARGGFLGFLIYAHENGYPWDWKTTTNAAYKGQLDCLKYAHENGCECSNTTVEYSTGAGNLDCFIYLIKNGFEVNSTAISSILREGYLNCLIYLHENGYKFEKFLTGNSSKNIHPDCLKYLNDNVFH